MNIERLRQLADKVKNLKHTPFAEFDPRQIEFTMQLTHTPCGTPACLAGHACELAGIKLDNTYQIIEDAEEWLDLTTEQGVSLFEPPVPWRDVTPAQAVRAINRLIDGYDLDHLFK